MPYTKTTWVSGGAPGISAENLNHLETQYQEVKSELAKASAGDIVAHGANLSDGTVSDTKIGNRTADQTIADLYSTTGTITQLLSWIVKTIKILKDATSWYDAPAMTITAIAGKFHEATGHKHSGAVGDAPNIPWINVSDKPSTYSPSGHATSHKTGNGDALAAADIGAETPSGAQTKVDTHANGTSVHSATSAATADRIMLRDGAGRAKVAAPSAADDIARKDTVDTKFDVSTGHDHDGTDSKKVSYGDLDGWVKPGDTELLSSTEEIGSISNYSVNIRKVFQIARPGRYRIKGEIRSGNAAYDAQVTIGTVLSWLGSNPELLSAGQFSTKSTTYVAFSIDMTMAVPPYGFIFVSTFSSSGEGSIIRNVKVCYADGGSPEAPAVRKTW